MNIIQPLPLTSSHSEGKDGRVQGYEYPGQGPGGKHDSVVTPDTVLTKVEGWPHTTWEIVLNAL